MNLLEFNIELTKLITSNQKYQYDIIFLKDKINQLNIEIEKLYFSLMQKGIEEEDNFQILQIKGLLMDCTVLFENYNPAPPDSSGKPYIIDKS